MNMLELSTHTDAIERAAKYADTSGDAMAAHNARTALTMLGRESRRLASLEAEVIKVAERHEHELAQADALLVARTNEREVLRREAERWMRSANATNEALAAAIRENASRSIRSQAVRLLGAIMERVALR